MLSKIVGIRICYKFSRALDLHLPFAVKAERVDPHAILLGIDFRPDPAAQLPELLGVQAALEDGVLHPFSEVLQGVRQLGTPTIVERRRRVGIEPGVSTSGRGVRPSEGSPGGA